MTPRAVSTVDKSIEKVERRNGNFSWPVVQTILSRKSGKQRKAAGRAAIDLGKLSAGELDALEKQIQQRRAAAADDADSD